MSFTYDTFEVDNVIVTLPRHAPQEVVDTGEAEGFYQPLSSGGGLDLNGVTEEIWPGVLRISRRGIYKATTEKTAHDQLMELTALQGKHGKLWRKQPQTSERHWTWARLARVSAPYTPANYDWLAVDTEFDRTARSWFSDASDLLIVDRIPSDEDLPTLGAEQVQSNAITLVNNGNAAVTAYIIEITAATGGLTSVTLTGGGAAWTWTGTVAAGQVLRINTGSRDVTVDNTAAYFGYGGGGTGFALDPVNHLVSDWLRIEPGTTEITVTTIPNAEHRIVITPRSGWK